MTCQVLPPNSVDAPYEPEKACGGQLTHHHPSPARGRIGWKRTSLFSRSKLGSNLPYPYSSGIILLCWLLIHTHTDTHAHSCIYMYTNTHTHTHTHTHKAVFPWHVLSARVVSPREIFSLSPLPSPSLHHSPETHPSKSRAPHPKASGKLTFLHIKKELNTEPPVNPATLNSMVPVSMIFVISTVCTGVGMGVTLCLLGNKRGQIKQICI